MSTRALGYKRGPADPRDKDAGTRLRAGIIPPSVDLTRLVVEVLDQGNLGACVAHGVAQTIRCDLVRQGVVSPPLPARLPIYFFARGYEGTRDEDAGCFVRDAYRGVGHYGFCAEAACPYSDDGVKFKQAPPWEALREAIDQRQKVGAPVEYHRIFDSGPARLTSIKLALASGHAVTFGTDVSEDFCSGALDPDAEKPPTDKPVAGGHCMTCVGFDERGRFRVLNSWSKDWADGGYVWFSSEYMTWARTDDLWIVDAAPALMTGGIS